MHLDKAQRQLQQAQDNLNQPEDLQAQDLSEINGAAHGATFNEILVSEAIVSEAVGEAAANQAVSQAVTAQVAPSTCQMQLEALEQSQIETQAQAEALDRERCSRIRQLEQALDQALICIEELQSQIQEQHLLETQLADTEDYASVQQQAIIRLKLQLSEQQQELEAQRLETQQRDQAIQELLATIETMTQAQQHEVERLQSRLAQDQQQVQSHRSRLGKHLQDLQSLVTSRQQRVAELETEATSARVLSTRLQNQLEGAQQQIKDLSSRLAQNHAHLVQLETQLEQSQLGIQESSQSRVGGLNQQVAEMQEQILQQAQQETEYETAVQYWKDRYTTSQAQTQHLKQLAQLLLQPADQSTPDQTINLKQPDLHPALLEILTMLQVMPTDELAAPRTDASVLPDQITAPPPISPRLSTVELPEFLMRRRAAADRPKARS